MQSFHLPLRHEGSETGLLEFLYFESMVVLEQPVS